tara:strand:+ start:874 stop:1065 length:192 start_codon:yes stop_codon:yes gene_type:complete
MIVQLSGRFAISEFSQVMTPLGDIAPAEPAEDKIEATSKKLIHLIQIRVLPFLLNGIAIAFGL